MTSNQPDEFKTIFSEAVDDAFHDLWNPKASVLRMPHLLFYRQRIIYIGESEAFAKHTKYAKHAFFKNPYFGCRSIRTLDAPYPC